MLTMVVKVLLQIMKLVSATQTVIVDMSELDLSAGNLAQVDQQIVE